ncbi:hypothetical protein QTP88_025732 [Uroleucon formosanum]
MKDHLSKIHSDKLEKPLSFFQALKAKIEKQSTVNSLFKKQTSDLDKGLVASYKVSLLIAKNSKPHSIGETLILPALKEIIDTMQGEAAKNLSSVLHETLQLVIRAVNKIKASSLNDRMFRELCHDNDEDFERLLLHTALKKDMKSRFQDLLELQICNWILDPFSFESVEDLKPHLQMEFIDLKHDCEAQLVFKQVGYELAWIKLKDTYPQLWQQVKLNAEKSILPTQRKTRNAEKSISPIQRKTRNTATKQAALKDKETFISPRVLRVRDKKK